MITISLCLIVKNEENTISKCLDSVKEVMDEIVIVDTGSTDKTIEIARKYTDHIYSYQWKNDFADARNYAFSKGNMDFLLWLDADDILLPKDVQKLYELKSKIDSTYDVVYFNYNYAFDGDGNVILTFKRERMVNRLTNHKWVGFVHEYIEVAGKVLEEEIDVTHTRKHGNGCRNLDIYREKLKEGLEFSSRDQYYYGKEMFYNELYQEAIVELDKFLKMQGWVEDRIDTINCMAICFEKLGDYKKARETLFQSFDEDVPRPDALYQIGKTYQMEQKFALAIYWYESIFHLNENNAHGGFCYKEYSTWKPHLELCICYYQLGNLEEAFRQNELAAEYIPNNEMIAYNRGVLKNCLQKLNREVVALY